MRGALGDSTLEMTRNIPEGDRVAVDIEGTTIGGIAGAYLFFKEAREVGGGYWGSDQIQGGDGDGDGDGEICGPSEAMEAPDRRKRSEPI